MSVRYSVEDGAFVIDSDTCTCGQPFYLSNCDAPGCDGRACESCGGGCDLDFVDDGDCASAIAVESDEDRAARINAERAAFGLSPISNP